VHYIRHTKPICGRGRGGSATVCQQTFHWRHLCVERKRCYHSWISLVYSTKTKIRKVSFNQVCLLADDQALTIYPSNVHSFTYHSILDDCLQARQSIGVHGVRTSPICGLVVYTYMWTPQEFFTPGIEKHREKKFWCEKYKKNILMSTL